MLRERHPSSTAGPSKQGRCVCLSTLAPIRNVPRGPNALGISPSRTGTAHPHPQPGSEAAANSWLRILRLWNQRPLPAASVLQRPPPSCSSSVPRVLVFRHCLAFALSNKVTVTLSGRPCLMWPVSYTRTIRPSYCHPPCAPQVLLSLLWPGIQ